LDAVGLYEDISRDPRGCLLQVVAPYIRAEKTNKKEREPTKINILVLSFLFFKAYIL